MTCEETLNRLRDDIVQLCAPSEILVFSQKQKLCGELSSVKLCVIIPQGDSRAVEHRLYVEVESDVSFDVLVYTQEEWQRLLHTEMSFAAHIRKTGRVIYEAD